MLQAVVIVGLPLEKPTLEVNALIKYYQKKFTRGWDYAYLYPAVNKALQAAGRCIRSSKDKGVVVFMDERYLWKNYRKCFPKDMPVIVSPDPQMLAKRFYSNT
jgi:DNA excision repair protein ERCC-2